MLLRVNGNETVAAADAADSLLTVLRERLGLTGTKEGCGRGECGACTVLVSGRPVLSCLLRAGMVDGPVETIEGLVEESAPLRRAFADHGGFQCGYCTPGQIVRGVALLREGLPPGDDRLRAAMSGNICRCTGYTGIVAALRAASGRPSGQS
ncbi:(2Fe-2S)-binding protein [Actinophytocola sp.]|uniref:(2Fe-2S)-binding protein n=1 Tax=Actinophytocola sp. TaxID=1872138 RepID=UPI003D6A92F1